MTMKVKEERAYVEAGICTSYCGNVTEDPL